MEAGRRRAWRIAAVLGILAAGGITLAATRDRPTPARAAPAATTTSAPLRTTTTVPTPRIDAQVAEIATAALGEVDVLEAPPAGFEPSTQAAVDGDARRAVFAPRSPERADAPDLPSLDEPIQGRHRTDAGWVFSNPTPWGNPLTFAVIEDHGEWLRVQMPVRPNGTEGWVRATDVTRTQTTLRLVIDVSDRHLWAYDRDTVVADTPVVVGKDATRTPTGRAYVTDIEAKPPAGAYGPALLALSVYSQDLDLFGGGVPVIAVHGTNRPDLLGSAASNGCIRIPNEVITLLRDRVPLGTPVDIVP